MPRESLERMETLGSGQFGEVQKMVTSYFQPGPFVYNFWVLARCSWFRGCDAAPVSDDATLLLFPTLPAVAALANC